MGTLKKFRALTNLSVNELPGDNNKYFEIYDNSGKWVFTADKNAFAESGGNGYILSKDKTIKIPVKNGFPQFDGLSVAQVNIEKGIVSDKDINFDMMDDALAKYYRNNPTAIPQEFRDYFNSNGININRLSGEHIETLRSGTKGLGYTWHESENLHMGYLVKTEIHAQISHYGGYSIIKNLVLQNNISSARQNLYNAIKWATY